MHIDWLMSEYNKSWNGNNQPSYTVRAIAFLTWDQKLKQDELCEEHRYGLFRGWILEATLCQRYSIQQGREAQGCFVTNNIAIPIRATSSDVAKYVENSMARSYSKSEHPFWGTSLMPPRWVTLETCCFLMFEQEPDLPVFALMC